MRTIWNIENGLKKYFDFWGKGEVGRESYYSYVKHSWIGNLLFLPLKQKRGTATRLTERWP